MKNKVTCVIGIIFAVFFSLHCMAHAGILDAFEKTKLPKKSWVKISQIRTLSVKRLRKKIGKVESKELELVVEGLNKIIGG